MNACACGRRWDGAVGREAAHQAPARQLRECRQGGAAGEQHDGHGARPLRAGAHTDPRPRREEPGAHHQLLVSICEYSHPPVSRSEGRGEDYFFETRGSNFSMKKKLENKLVYFVLAHKFDQRS